MAESPADNLNRLALNYYALGCYAPAKGLSREDCPYAVGTVAHEQWTAGFDDTVKATETATQTTL